MFKYKEKQQLLTAHTESVINTMHEVLHKAYGMPNVRLFIAVRAAPHLLSRTGLFPLWRTVYFNTATS